MRIALIFFSILRSVSMFSDLFSAERISAIRSSEALPLRMLYSDVVKSLAGFMIRENIIRYTMNISALILGGTEMIWLVPKRSMPITMQLPKNSLCGEARSTLL